MDEVSEQLEFPENTNPEESTKIKRIIEGILFASQTPLSSTKLLFALKEHFNVTKKQIEKTINELKEEYEQNGHSFELVLLADGYQLKTRKEYSFWIKKTVKNDEQEKLSKPALETLAIIAYKQPITRGEIEQIRGVSIDSMMKVLLEKGLIFQSGKKDIPGKPWQYSTTKHFLQSFGLKNIHELPPLGELNLN